MKQSKDESASQKLPNRRALLDLEGGNKRGLERAMQHLLGRKNPRTEAASVVIEAALKTLAALGFEVMPGSKPDLPRLTHPFAPGRVITLELPPTALENSEGAALEFASIHFPEMEFYLPFITTRARYQAARKKNGGRTPLGPEPEYDEDGFLMGE